MSPKTHTADAQAVSRASASTPGEILLQARDLGKDFGPVRAVRDFSFEVRRGEIVGLLGPNGAGKTTAMRMLVGYLVPSAGQVELCGGDIFTQGPRRKDRLGYLPENVPLYSEMTVREYLEMSARLKGLRGAPGETALARVRDLLDLTTMWRRPTGQLSRGFRQRVGLAQCLLADPDLLILDEPTTGLDPNQIAELRRLLRSWRQSKGILLSTHILAEALMLCDRVLIISKGRLVAAGSPQGLAGAGQEAAVTQITVRGPASDAAGPLGGGSDPGLRDLSATREEGEGDEAIWRLEGQVDREGRRALTARFLARDYEILEWNSGLSALEQTFRRLTIEEGSESEAE